MKRLTTKLLIVLVCLYQASLYTAQATSIEEVVMLVDKKRSALASGEVHYIITEGMISEDGAKKLRNICRNASFQNNVDIKTIVNIIQSDGSNLVTRNNTLLYSGDNFVLTEIVPSSTFDTKLIKLANLEGKDVVFKMSAFNGLYSFLDPFRNQLQINQTNLPDDYSSNSVLSLDSTLANYKNLLTPVSDRIIKLDQVDDTITIKFQRSTNGYELQKYIIQDGIIYLIAIDAVMGKSRTKTDKFLLNYSNHSRPEINIKSPSVVVDIIQPETGHIMFKYYKIENWTLRKVLDTEFLIELPPGVRLIK